MGLIEKRAIKDFQDKDYINLTKEINAIAGFLVEFEVHWDSLALEGSSDMYKEGFTKVYFIPVINAFKEITSDDMGKEALKETLKKIVIKNQIGAYSPGSAYSFEGGVLTIDHEPTTNIDDVNNRSEALTKLLSSKM